MGISKYALMLSLVIIFALFLSMFHYSSANVIRAVTDDGLNIVPVENYGYAPIVKHLIDNATSSIFISMNVISDYEPVKTLLNSLIAAKNRGVDVRVLFEGEISSNWYAVNYLREQGVNVKNDSSNTFLHTKMVVIDGKVVYIGSHNWSPYALGKNNEFGVFIFNSTIAEFYVSYFNSLWNDANITPEIGEVSESAGNLSVETTYDGYTYSSLYNLIASARDRLYVGLYTMAYYSDPNSTESRVDNLIDEVVDKGSIAKVVLDDHDSENAYNYLKNSGVNVIYDSSSTITHLKMVISDDSVYIGDANWDYEYLDNETHTVGVIIHNASVANFFAGYFNTIYKYGDAPYYIPDGFIENWSYYALPGDSVKINVYLANGGAKNDTYFHIIPHGPLYVSLNETPSWNRTSVYDWLNETAVITIPSDAQGNYTISLTFYSTYYHINYTMYLVIHVGRVVPELNPVFSVLLLVIVPVSLRNRLNRG